MIDFVVVSSGLQPYVLDTQVKREAELTTVPQLAEDGQPQESSGKPSGDSGRVSRA